MAKSHVDRYSITVLKNLEHLPLEEETRGTWQQALETDGLNEFLAKEILEKLPELPKPEDELSARRFSKTLMTITQNVRQWRLNQGLQHTRSQRR
ncbi:MAG: hypothetical protein HPY85_16505 [Anaerolineae bacterium]|jgi:hypothetical protein|nr:hypothetical protein [Anaerolineae bacterium]